MHKPLHKKDDIQRRLVNALLDPRYYPDTAKRVRLVETHISWVLLAGRYAYKIKKSVDLGFLDFTSLAARRRYCTEEIRLNRRLAPDIYLDVIPIGGTPDQPELGAQPAIEYAVRMRRFTVAKQLDRLLARDKILPQHLDNLAATLAHFHGSLPAAPAGSAFGTPAAIRSAAEQNFEHLQALLTDHRDVAMLAALHQATATEYFACEKLFEQRQAQGFVRECHSDLHLGNIVLIGQQPTPFDGIEFNPALRWIDVISDIAFTVMDLLHRQRPDLAYRFLNGYLEVTGDYSGIAVLRFYISYRAAVRAKVCAIRAFQPGITKRGAAQALANCRSFLALAATTLARHRPALIIMQGLPGSGKSLFAQAALQELRAICIRSDVERKRLFGLPPLAASRAQTGLDIYSTDATLRTYARLHELACGLLQAGNVVIVDAAFIKQNERAQFSQLAHELAVPFVIVTAKASLATLRARVTQRRTLANDPSEADLAVLESLLKNQEKLTPQERAREVVFVNDGAGEVSAFLVRSV